MVRSSNLPIGSGMSSSTIRFVAPVLLSLSVIMVAAVISVEVLSTLRAYVRGEGLYAKGQKDATYYLAQYAVSRSEDDFRQYQAAIAFPLGDRQARLALQDHPVDLAAARTGMLKGGNDSADIPTAIVLFRLFGGVGPVRQSIEAWTQADLYIERISVLAERLHGAGPAGLPVAQRAALLAELDRLNRRINPLLATFSVTLSDVARTTRNLLILALVTGTLITGLLCVRVTHARVRERLAKEQGLAHLTELYAALSRTSQLISRVSDRGELFDELCRICVGTSGLSLAAVGMLDGRSGIGFPAVHGGGREYLERFATHPAGGEAGPANVLHAVVTSRTSRVVNHERAAPGEFASEALFPLICRNEVVGVLCVFSRQRQYIRGDIVQLLEQLAMEASFALEGLDREAERRHQAGILADQNRILNLIASGAELRAIFAMLVQFLESQLEEGLCAIAALEQGGRGYSLVVAPSLPEGLADALDEDARRGGSGACAAAIATRSRVVRPDLSFYPEGWPLGDYARRADLQSVTAWPIFGSREQVLGALAIAARRGAEPSALNARLIGICTNLAGIAIENRRAADRIHHLAHHDELTGLPNRLLFNLQLPQAIARAQRAGTLIGVLFIDLDRFKVINDTLGHAAGDAVLRQIAGHLQGCLRTSDMLARVGGDEFTALVEQFGGAQDLGVIAQKLLAAVASPVTVDGTEYRLSGSIGIAVYPKDGHDGATLLRNADVAMYRAKMSGRNTYHFYANDLDGHGVERLALENELRQAVARRELEVHYQPKIDIPSGAIAGAEALVRWRHPRRGMLPSAEIISVAEEAGLIGAIGNLVLETVCTDLVQWNGRGLPQIRVAINLSAQQFADSRLLDNLDRVLRETGCDPRQLEFEITESVVMTNPDRALHSLEHIKTYGILLAIDDFGTGHSSLAYLKRFPVDSVKIDHAFIRDLAADPDDLAITKVIIALGHSLGLKVVAEGVETPLQLEILRRHHCDEFQGFLFSGAVPAAGFAEMLKVNVRVRPPDPDSGARSLATRG